MNTENAIRLLAGTMMLGCISLAHWLSQWRLLPGAVVGVNGIQSPFTGLCPAENIINKPGIGKGGGSCGR